MMIVALAKKISCYTCIETTKAIESLKKYYRMYTTSQKFQRNV